MRSRIMRAIMLAVAVTGFVLGIPLGWTALQLVDDGAHSDLAASARRIAAALDGQIASGAQISLDTVQVAIPQGAHLVVSSTAGEQRSGPDLGEDVLSEEVPIAQGGIVRLEMPSGPMRTEQAQVAVFVILLLVLSVTTGTVVATVTARKLSQPLGHVAARAARLGAGDFRNDDRRHGVAELDLVSEALDTSAAALALLVQRERELVGDVSHQLRSRLTALQLRLETLVASGEEEAAAQAPA